MRINHNISALNAWKNLNTTQLTLDKSLERLSSGLRINRAADDAAGLAISEKMRSQIAGLNAAKRNAQDAISLVQTAEGGLSETHSILQRMRELAIQAAGENLTDSDRQAIQEEVTGLTAEIDRIASDTEFNSKKLLNGELGVTITPSTGLTGKLGSLSATGDTAAGTYSLSTTSLTTLATAATISTTDTSTASPLTSNTTLASASSVSINGFTFSFSTTNTVQDVVNTINAKKDDTGIEVIFDDGADSLKFESTAVGSDAKIAISGASGEFNGGNLDLDGITASGTVNGTDATVTITGYANDYVASGNDVEFVKGDLKGLKFTVLTAGASVDVSTVDNANSAITALDTAIDSVSSLRGRLGATQNRLEHTIARLGTTAENMTAAESRIRDADMALEMASFTRNQILLQAGTAMLAQANMVPQSVLQLLG